MMVFPLALDILMISLLGLSLKRDNSLLVDFHINMNDQQNTDYVLKPGYQKVVCRIESIIQ